MGGALAAGNQPVSDDGLGIEVFTNPIDGAEPFAGLGETTEAELMLEGVVVGELSETEVAELLALPAVVSPAEEEDLRREVVLGFDTRTRSYTVDYPARAVVLISFAGGRCSEFLIGSDTVATAGHCLHPGGGGPFFDRSSYDIFPGFDGSLAPFGSCGAARLFSVVGWTRDGDERFDYGAIKLDCTVGNIVGWFGLRTNAGNDTPAIGTGYPGDKPLQQWQSSDKVRVTEPRQLFYTADSEQGNSGGPVWEDFFDNGQSRGPFAIAIHAYRTHGSGNHAIFNHGTRIVGPVFNNFVRWIAAPIS